MAIPIQDFYSNAVLGPGQITEHNPKTMIGSRAAEEDDIIFGRAGMAGTDTVKEVKTFSGAGGKFIGVIGYSTYASDLDNSKYEQYDDVSVVESGVVGVYVEEAVTPASPVRIRHTTSGAKIKGSFCTSAVAGETCLLTNAEFRASGASGTVVPMYLDPVFTTTADT